MSMLLKLKNISWFKDLCSSLAYFFMVVTFSIFSFHLEKKVLLLNLQN